MLPCCIICTVFVAISNDVFVKWKIQNMMYLSIPKSTIKIPQYKEGYSRDPLIANKKARYLVASKEGCDG